MVPVVGLATCNLSFFFHQHFLNPPRSGLHQLIRSQPCTSFHNFSLFYEPHPSPFSPPSCPILSRWSMSASSPSACTLSSVYCRPDHPPRSLPDRKVSPFSGTRWTFPPRTNGPSSENGVRPGVSHHQLRPSIPHFKQATSCPSPPLGRCSSS
jgi:hypothetical protein